MKRKRLGLPESKKETPELSQDQILKIKRLQLLEAKLKRQRELPHLFAHKMYPWQREFWESRNPLNFLTAANQIGKSSINIKKCIHWATAPSLWKELWPNKIKLVDERDPKNADTPGQFWYLYPDKKVATVEFHEKWVKEFLPKGEMKYHPVYGWKAEFVRKEIDYIRFNSGVTIYFKTYMQNPQSLQSGTVYAIFCDEELPFKLFDELNMRLSATNGYFHLVFTATLNQDEWRQTMQAEKGEKEKFPHAAKWQISLWMCMTYEDGSDTEWTKERIENKIANCGSQLEVQRRIYGKFISEQGKKYTFTYEKNVMLKKDSKMDKNWLIFPGVDYGSGGEDGHPSAMVFIAVSPDFTEGEVFRGVRMDYEDGYGVTTSGDLLRKYIEMEDDIADRISVRSYDYHARDFKTLADRASVHFEKANKFHDEGEDILNTLFTWGALRIHSEEYDLHKLCKELNTLKRETDKRKAKDDYSDSLRYAALAVPWDMERIKIKHLPPPTRVKTEEDHRREFVFGVSQEIVDDIESEIDEWNELLGS